MRRWTIDRVILIGSISVALLVGCSTGPSRTDALDFLERCDEGPLDAYCGTVEVWENREAQSGRRIALNVVVLPGVRRAENPDPLFYLAGGPGQGAAQTASGIQQVFRPVLADRDIVLVDQRGTGDSNSLACEFEDEGALDTDPRAFVRLLGECMEGLDADLRLYTTPIAMDDLNEVRERLGYDRVNLYGGSYGTRAAIVYVRRHPDTIRSVVLDGVAPPAMPLALYFARDAQRAFELLAADCAAGPDCAETFPNLADRFEQLLARLDQEPESITAIHPRTGQPEEVTVNRLLVSGIVFSALYHPETTAMLPFVIHRATQGDYRSLLALGSLAENVIGEMSLGMRYSVVCAEDAPRMSAEAIAREASGTFAGAGLAEVFLEPCEFWPRGEVPDDYGAPFASEAPTLVLSGEFDPVTPPVWGEQIAGQWPNARHLVAPGIGHGAITRGCLMRVVREFLNEPDPERLEAGCAQQLHRRPFFLGYAGPVDPDTASNEGGQR